MQEIIELCEVLNPSRLRYPNLIGRAGDKADQLFELVQSGEVRDKAGAIEVLYPEDRFPNEAFWHLKQKLLNRITNSIIALNDTEESEILGEFRSLQKKLYAYKLLRSKGQRKAALWIGERAIKKSIKYEFTEITLSLARELARYYASVKIDRKKYQYYSQLMQDYGRLSMKEMAIEFRFNEVVFQFAYQKFYDEELIEMVREKAEEVQAIVKEHGSFRNVLLAYNVIVYYHNLVKDSEGLLQSCQKAIALMEAKDYTPPYTAIFSFLIKTIPIYIQSAQYVEAQRAIDKCLALVPEDSHNWIISQQYQVLLNFHQEAYAANLQLIRRIKSKHARAIQNNPETWRIYEAYAAFLAGEKIRLGKFLNEVPIFSKDKRGMNINILILQILFLLRQGKRNDIIDRMAALERYSYRYLKKGKTFRSNCFINMLLQLEKGYFHPIAIQRKAKRFVQKLQTVPLSKSDQDIEIEIIPYERLWRVILGMLE